MEEEPSHDGYIYSWVFDYKVLDPQGREIIVLEKVKITEEVEGNSSVISIKFPGRRRRPGITIKNKFESEEDALEYFKNYFEDKFSTYLQNIKKLVIYFKNSDRIEFDRIYIYNSALILSKIKTLRTLFIGNEKIKTTIEFICTTTSFDINFSFNYLQLEKKIKKYKKKFHYLYDDYFYYELDRFDPIRFYKNKWKEIADKANELYQQSTVKTLIRRTLI